MLFSSFLSSTLPGLSLLLLLASASTDANSDHPPAGKPCCHGAEDSLQEATAAVTSTISKDQVTLSISSLQTHYKKETKNGLIPRNDSPLDKL
jgi:hypothetical protein